MGIFNALVIWEGEKVPMAPEKGPVWFDDYLDAIILSLFFPCSENHTEKDP